MKLEDKLYIEEYLCKAVSLCLEAGYAIDKFGNMVFKDKNETIENINKLISDSTKEVEASESEIRDYLVHIYILKCRNSEFIKESTELISILESTKQDTEIDKANQNKDKNKSKEDDIK